MDQPGRINKKGLEDGRKWDNVVRNYLEEMKRRQFKPGTRRTNFSISKNIYQNIENELRWYRHIMTRTGKGEQG